MYQGFGNSPLNYSDPLGLCIGPLQKTRPCQVIAGFIERNVLGVDDQAALDHGRAQQLIAAYHREHGKAPAAGETIAYEGEAAGRYLTGDGRWRTTTGEIYAAHDELLFVGGGAGIYTAASRTAGRGLARQAAAIAGSVADDAAGEVIGVNPSAGGTLFRKAVDAASEVRFVYRGDSRHPEQIFDEGFRAWGTSTDVLAHTVDNKNPPSAFIPTSRSFDSASNTLGARYVYVVRNRGGVDVNVALGMKNPYPSEQEILIPFRISPSDIRGASPLKMNGNPEGFTVLNPNYNPDID